MVILDHFVLGLGCGRGESVGRLKECKREMLMWGAANWSVCGVVAGPPVMTKLPLAVHLAATSWTCGGVIAARSLFRVWHSTSGLTRSSVLMPNLARSTSRLGLGGLDPVIAEKLRVGGLWGVGNFCLLLFALASLLEWGGGGGLFQGLNCLRQLLEGILDLLEVQIGGCVDNGLSRGITCTNELFDDGVCNEGEEVGLYFSQPDVRCGVDNHLEEVFERLGRHGNIGHGGGMRSREVIGVHTLQGEAVSASVHIKLAAQPSVFQARARLHPRNRSASAS